MVDHEGPWSKAVTSIAHWRGTALRSVKNGRAYVIICGSGACVRATPFVQFFKFLILILDFRFMFFNYYLLALTVLSSTVV